MSRLNLNWARVNARTWLVGPARGTIGRSPHRTQLGGRPMDKKAKTPKKPKQPKKEKAK
jgi:hypothetical protein